MKSNRPACFIDCLRRIIWVSLLPVRNVFGAADLNLENSKVGKMKG